MSRTTEELTLPPQQAEAWLIGATGGADRAIGVPTFQLDGRDGPAVFGPVIVQVPEGDAARELWEHFAWLARNENVYEVKRERSQLPDLEGIRLAQIRRAARQAAQAEG